jgi:hypothetical protein
MADNKGQQGTGRHPHKSDNERSSHTKDEGTTHGKSQGSSHGGSHGGPHAAQSHGRDSNRSDRDR